MTLFSLAADTCPSCQNVHGQPTDWPTCPEHGHWLYILRGPLAQKDIGWTYACQAHGCTYTHTQKEKATMTTTNEAASAALAIRNGQDAWTPKQVAALEQLGIEGAPQAHLQVFFDVCQVTGLNPFAKQIRLRKDRQRDANGDWQEQWSIETEIDGYRVIAARAAKREGVTLSSGPPLWFDHNEREHKIWGSDDLPAGAEYTVCKDGAPFTARVSFKSFAKRNRDGKLMAQWAVMPDHMIAVRAESHALRKAFPHDLEGISLTDERPAAPEPAAQEPPRAIPAPRQKPAPHRSQPSEQNGSSKVTEALLKAIGQKFDGMDITDEDERDNWLHKLANKPNGETLTDHDLRGALGDLAGCADLAALVELCNPEPAS